MQKNLRHLKSTALILFSSILIALSTITVFAQTNCTLNGKSVPCEEVYQSPIFLVMMSIFGVMAFLFLIGSIFWLYMFVHLIVTEVPNKVIWVIILLFFGPIGALVYYFTVKKPLTPINSSGVITQATAQKDKNSPLPPSQNTKNQPPEPPKFK